jgi:UDP-galactopyranose mutase
MTFMMTNSSFTEPDYDLICFSHLRWDFVFQRPQHLLTRFAKNHRVFFIEEPIFGDDGPRLEVSQREDDLFVAVPYLPHGTDVDAVMPDLIEKQANEHGIYEPVMWFYTPMMLPWAGRIKPKAIVYDCMDELSLFKGAPPQLLDREVELFRRADLVFTGGQSLYEAKRERHPAVYAFPSSIDVEHFSRALEIDDEPADQQGIAHPRVGFCGVIDERTDLDLLTRIAELRPDWQYIMLGPVAKIDQADLPCRDNIHYLGGKSYNELPAYLAGWDVAMMPFAMNDSTRFISPTKTPEYLAAGRPVVSTPVRDVVRPYGEQGLVYIAALPEEFVMAIENALSEDAAKRQAKTQEFLSRISWNKTQREMSELIKKVIARSVDSKAVSI